MVGTRSLGLMTLLVNILLILHLIGWAIVLGSAVVSMRTPTIPKGMFHGILTALVTGILMIGVMEMGDMVLNHMKYGIKGVVALIIAGMVIWGGKNSERVTKGFLGGIAGLTVLNIALGVLL